MSLLKPNSYVGVDIGTSGIKVVQLKKNLVLEHYGEIELPYQLCRSESPKDLPKLVEALKRVKKEVNITSEFAQTALPGALVFTRILELPLVGNHEKIDQAVRWQARQYVPVPIEEVYLDWYAIDVPPRVKSLMQILIVAAPKTIVNHYLSVFQSAGFNLRGLEIESFALQRSLIGDDERGFVIVDVGASTTEINISYKSSMLLNRNLDIGCQAMIRNIAENLGIKEERAYKFLKKFGLEPDKLVGQIPKALSRVLNDILAEIREIRRLFKVKFKMDIEKIVLSGGGARIPYLSSFLQDQLGKEVILGDPWSRINYPKRLEGELKKIGPNFAVAVGLAMRELV